jgi:Nucleotide-diphospho-sugar transferase
MTARRNGLGVPRLCLATSYSSDFADIGDYCAMTLQLYAARWGHAVHVNPDVAIDRPPAWHRVKLIPELFDQGYEFVLWLDADATFVRFDADILAEVRQGKDLYLVEHDHPNFPSSRVPNTGVMLVRNTQWSRDLFARLWSMTQYENHNWWENAAAIHLLGYRNLLGEGPYAPDQAIVTRVRFLDEAWNHVPTMSTSERPIIRHHAGFPNDVRRHEMPRDAVHAYRDALSDVTARNAALEQELASLRSSRSWRVTAPLRRIGRTLRFLVSGNAPANPRA